MKLHSVGDRVAEGAYRLHSRFRRAANYTNGARLVCLSDRSVGSGPINIIVEGEIPEADSITVEPHAVFIGAMRYALCARLRYDSSLPQGPLDPARVEELAAYIRASAHPKSLAFLLDESRIAAFRDGFEQALIRQVREGAAKLFGDDLAQGVQRLRGCGFGLTPSGDDFLAGVLIGLHLVTLMVGRVPRPSGAGAQLAPLRGARRSGGLSQAALPSEKILAAARGENVLSNAFLNLARDGRVNKAMKQLAIALAGRDATNVRLAADRVLAQGETSGADVLTGLVLAMQKGTSTSTD